MAMLGLLPAAPTTWVCLFAAPAIVVLLTAAGLLSNAAAFRTSAKSLPPSVFETIKSGRIAVIPDFLSPEFISELRADATKLHESGKFSTDALASYGKNGKFDPRYDRQVLRLGQWQDPTLGNSVLREQFAGVIADVRASLAVGLERPGLARGHATTDFGKGSTEISYTRFGPGAFLKRHLDEHHEELKGRFGWQKPTRRSVSWLVYLNRGWDGARHGGQLRCYERAVGPASPVGARPNGDLQLGWLRATAADPAERPVFLDARRPGPAGNCALYCAVGGPGEPPVYISRNFHAQPVLFLSGDFFAQRLLVDNPRLAPRFHYLEPPHSKLEDLLLAGGRTKGGDGGERARDVYPEGGTLVLFDSVTLPHEVLPTRERPRWACSGWFHEDQQAEPGAGGAAAA